MSPLCCSDWGGHCEESTKVVRFIAFIFRITIKAVSSRASTNEFDRSEEEVVAGQELFRQNISAQTLSLITPHSNKIAILSGCRFVATLLKKHNLFALFKWSAKQTYLRALYLVAQLIAVRLQTVFRGSSTARLPVRKAIRWVKRRFGIWKSSHR